MKLPIYKKIFPFRLGCTSYVYPEDIIPNVEKMAGVVDNIELILFESPDTAKLPSFADIEKLKGLSEKNNLTYTVHLPIDKKAGALDKTQRKIFLKHIREIILLTESLNPLGYVLHLDGVTRESPASAISGWKENVDEICREIACIPNLDPSKICIENLEFPIEWNINFVELYNFSYCMDIGHFWINRKDWMQVCKDLLRKTKIFHLHGSRNGRAHLSLKEQEPEKLTMLYDHILCEYKNVVTLEVFNSDGIFESLKKVKSTWVP
jgi:sugar phosphate isomerase/epimerase